MTPPLGPDDRVRLETLFDRAADLPTAERAAFVARECGQNVPLRNELARLLAGLAGADARLTFAPTGPLAPGTTIGAYRLLERVGQGGMGEVYAAEQRTPVVRRVALKVIKLGMDSAEIVARFEAERQAMARMTHENIAQVYDGGTMADGRPYDDRFSLDGVVNLSDTHASKNGGLDHERAWEGNDGATMHAPVDSYRPNGVGLFNVAGNVFEWCIDGHDREFYAHAPAQDPLARADGDQPRVHRGGAYRGNPNGARSASRQYDVPGKAGHAQGVRAARAITP